MKTKDENLKRLLIIDDEEDLCLMLKIRLELFGFSVDFACNAEQGWKKIKSFKPDAIILDVVMPGVSGWELCNKIKSDPETKHIHVYICTATQADGQVVTKAKNVGADNAFVKPFDEAYVFNEIKNVLENPNVASH